MSCTSSVPLSIFPNPLFSGDSIPLVLNFWLVKPDPKAVPPVPGTADDLSGKTLGLTIKNNPADLDSASVFKQDIAGDTTGTIGFAIPSLAEGLYWLDVKMWDSSNIRSSVIPPCQFSVERSITERLIPMP